MSASSSTFENSGEKPAKKKMPQGRPWQPGQSGNPGGAPKGKRISTWMAEFGEMSEAQLRKINKSTLPMNGKIALGRLRAAASNRKDANAATETILERTEGKVTQPLAGNDGQPLTIQVMNYGATKGAPKS